MAATARRRRTVVVDGAPGTGLRLTQLAGTLDARARTLGADDPAVALAMRTALVGG